MSPTDACFNSEICIIFFALYEDFFTKSQSRSNYNYLRLILSSKRLSSILILTLPLLINNIFLLKCQEIALFFAVKVFSFSALFIMVILKLFRL